MSVVTMSVGVRKMSVVGRDMEKGSRSDWLQEGTTGTNRCCVLGTQGRPTLGWQPAISALVFPIPAPALPQLLHPPPPSPPAKIVRPRDPTDLPEKSNMD